MIELIERANHTLNRKAIVANDKSYSFQDLLEASENVAAFLLKGKEDLNEARVAFLVKPSFEYVALQWGIWRAGGIAVPLCTKHPLPSIKYVIDDTQADFLICTGDYQELLAPLKHSNFHLYKNIASKKTELPDLEMSRRAMILYTSGTTGNPKGVVTTHENIKSQITDLTISWQWQANDHILNILPLHHVHGIVNMLCCAMWSGACCQFLPSFNEDRVFDIFCKGEVNLFMAVPTIYYKLINRYNELPKTRQEEISKALGRFRFMVSGSAALPVSTLEQWRNISGHTLLERYGMTEMGMAISNPYNGERRPGHIGQPLPGVTVRLADEEDNVVEEGTQGEIQVKGANVFSEYWQKPEETQKTFTKDGWFKTGDIALLNDGYYRILGRNSVDIIKSGGYKISALEIEEVLRKHPDVKDVGVVGLPDPEWGEKIAACLVPSKAEVDIHVLKEWMKERLPGYKLPRTFIQQEDLPRNVLGKVTKNELKKLFSVI